METQIHGRSAGSTAAVTQGLRRALEVLALLWDSVLALGDPVLSSGGQCLGCTGLGDTQLVSATELAASLLLGRSPHNWSRTSSACSVWTVAVA